MLTSASQAAFVTEAPSPVLPPTPRRTRPVHGRLPGSASAWGTVWVWLLLTNQILKNYGNCIYIQVGGRETSASTGFVNELLGHTRVPTLSGLRLCLHQELEQPGQGPHGPQGCSPVLSDPCVG